MYRRSQRVLGAQVDPRTRVPTRDSTPAPFQRVLHAAARAVLDLKPRDRVTPALRELHWLPVAERIQYKLCLLVYKSRLRHTPESRLPIFFEDDLHCVLHRVATSSCRGHIDGLATEPFLLLYCEHGTGYRRS